MEPVPADWYEHFCRNKATSSSSGERQEKDLFSPATQGGRWGDFEGGALGFDSRP